MAFDAGMMAAVAAEVREALRGMRVDKIGASARDEILLTFRGGRETRRLLLSASSSAGRVCLVEGARENPASPPPFCTLLRRHLSGARLRDARTPGFERVALLDFDARDDMGFPTRRALAVEVLGGFGNIVLLDEWTDALLGGGDAPPPKILGVLRPVDLTKSDRALLPGLLYRLPPPQAKVDPRFATREEFASSLAASPREMCVDKYFVHHYAGISPLAAREICFAATGRTSAPIGQILGEEEHLFAAYREVIDRVLEERFDPCLVTVDGKPAAFSYFPIREYGKGGEGTNVRVITGSASEVVRGFYERKAAEENLRERAHDILQVCKSASARLSRKIALQEEELAECAGKDELRRRGELILENLPSLRKGDKVARVIDYSSPAQTTVTIELDARVTPQENAQRLFKKYRKYKRAEGILTEQISVARKELQYLSSVRESVSRCESARDLDEVRAELAEAGYARRARQSDARKGKSKTESKKRAAGEPMEFRTRGGYRVFCGKNNLQNEQLSLHTAEKSDLWFHAKGISGAHVILALQGGSDAPREDVLDAATIAATYSAAAEGVPVDVDVTRVKHLKKPAAARPGMVIYHTNRTLTVRADRARCEEMRLK